MDTTHPTIRPPSPWRTWRQRLGWTQQQAASAACVSQSIISGIERGEETSMATARALIAAYGVSEEEAGAVLVAARDGQS